ncbi:ferredoxin [Bradyrhizobium sp. CB3481]|uniref:ferredoxin n=1 Tax=Bradyrhizobium sp. CB3481 TaxID=3039158 RepID=UPI0024B0CFAA|nr:ferredoxin [Bradyrhizobium sp. CB3481]WFU18147.1 ferredoxin [Bradyrhizobium sp. CB3481]
MSEKRVLTVKIDPDKCQGHARCHALAAELFELDELGNARVRGSGQIPAALEDRAWIARVNCPELAVEIIEEREASGR